MVLTRGIFTQKIGLDLQGIYPYYGATGILDYLNYYSFDGRYLLIAEDGSVINEDGTPVVQLVDGKFCVSNHAHVLKGINNVSTELLYIYFKQLKIRPYITGSVQLKLSQSNLKQIPFILPDAITLNKCNILVKYIFDKVQNNLEENLTLSQLRDTLLPKLISGEIRVM